MSESPSLDLYAAADRERLVEEPPKRVDAPVRTAFERDRARVVHAASSRRLAAKTQVVGPQTDDFVRNRLTHSLEVAQVARDLARALGCHPDLAETAALAHDLGHPPFGHNGERSLADLTKDCGGFEGNAQTLRLLTRLEAKTFDADGRSVGLNLTRATLDACTKYPWPRSVSEPPRGLHADGSPRTVVKFGVYDDDRPVFDWMRRGATGTDRCVEAQVMDLADDVAYSVHDVEDGVVAGRVDLAALDREAVWQTVREWYVADASDAVLDEVLDGLVAVAAWPRAAYDGSRRHLAALKNLTSDLIGRFCGAVQEATFAAGEGPFVRYRASLAVPERTRLEIAVLKGVAAHYVMRADDRLALMERQRELLAELVEALLVRGPDGLDRPFADDWAAAGDDSGRLRVVVDQVASLTDASAVSRHAAVVDL
jgi:dGTPase